MVIPFALLGMALAVLCVRAVFERRRELNDYEAAVRAVALPAPYDAMALREMRIVKAAGVVLTAAKADRIVDQVSRVHRRVG